MSALILFVTTSIVVLIVGVIAKAVAGVLVGRAATNVAAFSFVLGFAVARFSGNASTYESALSLMATTGGAALGLAGLHWFWFKRTAPEVLNG